MHCKIKYSVYGFYKMFFFPRYVGWLHQTLISSSYIMDEHFPSILKTFSKIECNKIRFPDYFFDAKFTHTRNYQRSILHFVFMLSIMKMHFQKYECNSYMAGLSYQICFYVGLFKIMHYLFSMMIQNHFNPRNSPVCAFSRRFHSSWFSWKLYVQFE